MWLANIIFPLVVIITAIKVCTLERPERVVHSYMHSKNVVPTKPEM